MRYLFGTIIIFVHLSVHASMPVIDAAAIAKMLVMIDRLKQQYTQMKDDFAESQLQSGVLSDQLSSIMGAYPFGDIYNTINDKSERAWLPNSVEEFEDMLRFGFNPGDLADRYAYYQEKFPAISEDKLSLISTICVLT